MTSSSMMQAVEEDEVFQLSIDGESLNELAEQCGKAGGERLLELLRIEVDSIRGECFLEEKLEELAQKSARQGAMEAFHLLREEMENEPNSERTESPSAANPPQQAKSLTEKVSSHFKAYWKLYVLGGAALATGAVIFSRRDGSGEDETSEERLEAPMDEFKDNVRFL